MEPVVIGLDVGGTFLKGGLVDRRGRILRRLRRPAEALRGRRRSLENVFSILRELETGPFFGEIKAIGIGAPGLIDLRRGIVSTSPNFPEWRNLPLRRLLAAKFTPPVFLENDANAAALGEKWMGAARGLKDFCLITLGTGVGGGLVLGGEVWHGADGMAGEIGHMTIDPAGPLCLCGNRGCLEMYASANALRRMVLEARSAGRTSRFFHRVDAGPLDGETIHRGARDGDRLCREAFRRMGSALGIGISNLVNLLNVEGVILGGALAAAWRFFIPSVRNEVKSRAFLRPARRARIVCSAVGEDAGLLGSAFLAWHSLGSI
ncbi:MAG: ROK family protein [Deltaproteobacteria bacterium]|nr:ROK family protein [Deltaproteobacteria bacterium]